MVRVVVVVGECEFDEVVDEESGVWLVGPAVLDVVGEVCVVVERERERGEEAGQRGRDRGRGG